MKSQYVFGLLLLYVCGCNTIPPTESQKEPVPSTQFSAASEAVNLSVEYAAATVDQQDELTLFVTLVFFTDDNRHVMVDPFAWGAYRLSSPDVEVVRTPPEGSAESFFMSMLGCTSRLDHFVVPAKESTVAIDYRLSRGESWIYYLKGLPAEFNGPIRFRLRYSFKGVESNEAEFTVNVVRVKKKV